MQINAKLSDEIVLTLAKSAGIDEHYPEFWSYHPTGLGAVAKQVVVNTLAEWGYTEYEDDAGFLRPIRKKINKGR